MIAPLAFFALFTRDDKMTRNSLFRFEILTKQLAFLYGVGMGRVNVFMIFEVLDWPKYLGVDQAKAWLSLAWLKPQFYWLGVSLA